MLKLENGHEASGRSIGKCPGCLAELVLTARGVLLHKSERKQRLGNALAGKSERNDPAVEQSGDPREVNSVGEAHEELAVPHPLFTIPEFVRPSSESIESAYKSCLDDLGKLEINPGEFSLEYESTISAEEINSLVSLCEPGADTSDSSENSVGAGESETSDIDSAEVVSTMGEGDSSSDSDGGSGGDDGGSGSDSGSGEGSGGDAGGSGGDSGSGGDGGD